MGGGGDPGGMGEDRVGAGARYAVVFREQGGPSAGGSLELTPTGLKLAGRTGDRLVELCVTLDDVLEVRIGRRPPERLNGYPTVVVERMAMPAVHLAPLGASLLHEVADLLTALTVSRPDDGDELAVLVPLKRGRLDRAKELLERGPPLDPAALGLTGHDVYIREHEAVFVFRGPNVSARVGKAMHNPALWRAGIAWQGCIASRPRIVKTAAILSSHETPIYSWTAAAKKAS
jgi:hypothetical protein